MGQQWYDWFVYANFALYFAGQFFPEGDRTAQLMNTAAVFAVGLEMGVVGGEVGLVCVVTGSGMSAPGRC